MTAHNMTPDDYIELAVEEFRQRVLTYLAVWKVAYQATYRHNKYPPYAGMWDKDPAIRKGAACFAFAVAEKHQAHIPMTKRWYLQRLKVETDSEVKMVLHLCYSQLVDIEAAQ